MSKERAAVDNSAWDGNAAMTGCETAADYEAICAGRKAGPPEQRSSWALPHHSAPGDPPNADGVRGAEARFGQTQGLTNKAAAKAHLDAHMKVINPDYAASAEIVGETQTVPPRDNLVRASAGGFSLERAAETDGMPVLHGHAAVFNEWTKIDSLYEGTFMERIAPGAFKRTINNNRAQMRILFNHGQDPQIGDKPLAPIETLDEDATGLAYSGHMLDTTYNRDLIPGLRADLYGSSFRFRVVKQDYNSKAKASDYNPEGLPERTVQEASVMEFGPVTFPAYIGAGAGLRSMTDRFVLQRLASNPERLEELVEELPIATTDDTGPEETHSDQDPAPATPERVVTPRQTRKAPPPISREDFLTLLKERNDEKGSA